MLKKPLCLALLFLLFVTLALPITVWAEGRGFYPDGELKWEYLFQNGEISEAKWYNDVGQLVSREIYVAGKPQATEGYRPDGSLEWRVRRLAESRQEISRFDVMGQVTVTYQAIDDQPDGEYRTFFSDGQPSQILTYRQGVLDGPARTFFPSGTVEHEFTYRNGEVDGPCRTYSPAGNLLTEYLFEEGQLQ